MCPKHEREEKPIFVWRGEWTPAAFPLARSGTVPAPISLRKARVPGPTAPSSEKVPKRRAKHVANMAKKAAGRTEREKKRADRWARVRAARDASRALMAECADRIARED